MSNIYIKTMGCKVNTFDSQVLCEQFSKKGHSIVPNVNEADVAIINTCSVTENAEKEARYWLRRYRRENPTAVRVVTGCYAQINSSALAKLPEVDYIVPNEAKEKLVGFVDDRIKAVDPRNPEKKFVDAEASKMPDGVSLVEDNKQKHFKSSLVLFDKPQSKRSRSFLKIQDGCDGFCTYCQIPYARGVPRSVPVAEVLDKAKALVEEGTSEITLTGIHIGDYGDDLGDSDALCELLDRLRAECPSLSRLRISSLEPGELTIPLVKAFVRNKDILCDHFHLPLQSGSDQILKKMNRKYSADEYAAAVALLRAHFPRAHISADVICGFPGETEAHFQETVSLIEKCHLGSLHAFPYSKRPNTAAARMPGHIEPQVTQDRVRRLRSLSERLLKKYSSQFIGENLEVLWEEGRDTKSRPMGKTRNYLSVAYRSSSGVLPGDVSRHKLLGYVDTHSILCL